jgi:hypothetical protein
MLAREAGTADAQTIAVVAMGLNEHLFQRLAPVIGDMGITAVYARAVNLAKRQSPGILPISPSKIRNSRRIDLQEVLAQQEAGVALDGAVAIMTRFVELLAELVGEELTDHLLRDVWPNDFD